MPRRVLLIGWMIAAFAVMAEARPGGGHTSSGGSRTGGGGSSRSSSSGGGYSSSGSTSSSSSSSGGYSGEHGALIFVSVLGGFILLVVAANLISRSRERTVNIAPTGKRRRVIDLKPLLKRDPDFSRAVFEDFAFELYAAAHRDRGTAGAAYISGSALEKLASRGPSPQQVVIGTLRIHKVSYFQGPPEKVSLLVHVEATLIGERNVYAIEQWTFTRRGEVTSKPPTRTRTWPCPNCGAPWQANGERACAHCGESPAGGRFDWMVESIRVFAETNALASLRGTVPEQGNDLPTVVEASAHEGLRQIGAVDSHVTWEALTSRIRLIYAQLNTAWNERDLAGVRGFVTASLRNYLDYWLREYARQGLHNTLADAKIEKIELAKVTRDRYFDAITVRIFANGVDFTRTEDGKVVGGSKDKRRPYTEYWTFVRSAGRRGAVHTDVACPNCGAPIAMSDIGDCTHCNAAIENGSIDWTLSRIEQDDSYAG